MNDMKITANYNEGKEACLEVIRAGLIPILWGGPGIGKSSMAKEIAKELNYNIEDIRLNLYNISNLIGIPFKETTVDGKIKAYFSEPCWLNPQQTNLYFFDELGNAMKSVQDATFQLFLDRRVGPHKLKENDILMAASNNKSDNDNINKLSKPLRNRLVHINLEAHLETTLKYAKTFNPIIKAFLRFKPELLYKPSNEGAFPTPRSWENVNNLLKKPLKQESIVLAGTIGYEESIEFMAFKDRVKYVPNITNILKGIPEKVVEEPDTIYTTMEMMLNELEKEEDIKLREEQFKHGLEYWEKNPNKEYSIAAINTIMNCFTRTQLTKMEVFQDWVEKNYTWLDPESMLAE